MHSILAINLGRVPPNLGDHYPVQAVFRRVKGAGRKQNQYVVTGFGPVVVILIRTLCHSHTRPTELC